MNILTNFLTLSFTTQCAEQCHDCFWCSSNNHTWICAGTGIWKL